MADPRGIHDSFERGEERDEDALGWFMGCFPIRADEARQALRAALFEALAEKKRRLG